MSDHGSRESAGSITAGIVLGGVGGVLLGCGGIYAAMWAVVPDQTRQPHEFQGLGHLVLMFFGAAVGGAVGLILGPLFSGSGRGRRGDPSPDDPRDLDPDRDL